MTSEIVILSSVINRIEAGQVSTLTQLQTISISLLNQIETTASTLIQQDSLSSLIDYQTN